MVKCNNCNKDLNGENMLSCPNCSASICSDCAKKSNRVCPYCFSKLEYVD